jgi:hypothetical protein
LSEIGILIGDPSIKLEQNPTSTNGFNEDIGDLIAQTDGLTTKVIPYQDSIIITDSKGFISRYDLASQKFYKNLLQIPAGIKDLVTKTTNNMTSIINITDGNIKTMTSKENGQIGKSLGKCFHPETKIKLQNGSIKYIKDIDLGDILEDGAIVETVMKIDNKKEQIPLYKIKQSGVNNENIYVTGSHLVYDPSSKLFVPVQNYAKSEISKDFHSEWFSCLITNSHNIKIGSELFWDWEDHAIKLTLY